MEISIKNSILISEHHVALKFFKYHVFMCKKIISNIYDSTLPETLKKKNLIHIFTLK